MGNINNTWYLKGSGGDWASAKCALDDCYSIPFDPVQDDSLYLQADLPEGYTAQEVWLSAPDGPCTRSINALHRYMGGANRIQRHLDTPEH